MWEYTDADDADLGYTYSKPSIAKMPDGKWYAIFGNGYNNTVPDTHTSTTGDAVLYLVQLDNKSNVIKLDTKAGYKSDPLSLDRPNGLSSPAVVDLDGDGVVDMVYAGDLYGNVWKFKFAGTDKSAWGIPYTTGTNAPAPLFIATDSAGNRQPITTRPQVGLGRRGEGTTVLVGTGKFLESSDRVVADIGTQTFYGIWDRNLKVDKLTDGAVAKVSRSDLQEQSVLTEVTPPGGTELVRVTSQNAIGSKLGWYMDLPAAGEIQVTNSALRNRRVIFTTQIPSDDPCAGGGTSWLMELDYLTGARLEDSAFDLNNDGKFDAADLIKVVINGKEYVITASGVKSTNGIWSQPAFLTSGADEFLFMSTSNTNDGTGSGCNESTLVCRRNGVPPTTYGRQSWRQVK
jgi:type IV pilus assembly protein PilY1